MVKKCSITSLKIDTLRLDIWFILINDIPCVVVYYIYILLFAGEVIDVVMSQ